MQQWDVNCNYRVTAKHLKFLSVDRPLSNSRLVCPMFLVAGEQVDERIQRHYDFSTKRILLTRDPKDVSRRGQCDFTQFFLGIM